MTMRTPLLLAPLLLALAPQRASARPNIVFIFSDDHAEQAISAYGSRLVRTPHIDRLAKEGARFASSFVTNSLCSPSRATILTGKFGHLNGVRVLSEAIAPGQTTFPQLLQKAGYQTALVGKWHLKDDPTGFDHWEVLPGQGSYYNPEFITARGRVRDPGYVGDLITTKSVEWLRKRDPDRPFLLLVHHKAPHRSWEPGPEELPLFAKTVWPAPPTLFDDYRHRASPARNHKMGILEHLEMQMDLKVWREQDKASGEARGFKGTYGRLDDEQRRRWDAAYEGRLRAAERARDRKALTLWKYQEYLRDYLRCVAGVDKSVGKILAFLDEAGLAKDTVVVYGSDQGFYLGEHGWYDKRWMYEESFRTPLLVRWPGVTRPGTVVRELVQNLDYAQTFLEIAGIPAPEDMQGMSLVPLLRGQRPQDWRRSLYYHYYDETIHGVPRHYGVRTERFKLIRFPSTDEWELFDLQKDPRELRSVHADPRYAKERAALEAELERLRQHYRVPAGE